MTLDERDAILQTWDLLERRRIIDTVLGKPAAGWERARHPVTGRDGVRAVLRIGRKVIWRSEAIHVFFGPSDHALPEALDELERRAFNAWKAEKGIQ